MPALSYAAPALRASGALITLDEREMVEWANRLVYVASRMPALKAKISKEVVEDMVSVARRRVARDTGLLQSGITGTLVGEVWEFRAQAQRTKANGKLTADYGPFVEWGTHGGKRGKRVVEGAMFAETNNPLMKPREIAPRGRRGKAPKGRISYRTHPGTDAQPFFYSSAAAVLAGWRLKAREDFLKIVKGS